ncbi:MAG: hypothetical protein ACK4OM_06450 [Alphaproteobacteria bacterium]
MPNIENSDLKRLIEEEIEKGIHNFEKKNKVIYASILETACSQEVYLHYKVYFQGIERINFPALKMIEYLTVETDNIQFIKSFINYYLITDKKDLYNFISTSDFKPLQLLIKNGDFEIVKLLCETFSPKALQNLIFPSSAVGFEHGNFMLAVEKDYSKIVGLFLSIAAPENALRMVTFSSYMAFKKAIEYTDQKTAKYIYMAALEHNLSNTIIEDLDKILQEHGFNAAEFKQQILTRKEISKKTNNLNNFMLVSKNPSLTLTSQDSQFTLPKNIMLNHVLNYVASIEGSCDKYNSLVIEQLYENKQKVLNSGTATPTTRKTFVEQVKARAADLNEELTVSF